MCRWSLRPPSSWDELRSDKRPVARFQLDVGLDPSEQAAQTHRSGLPRDFPAAFEGDERRNTSDREARRDILLDFGIELGEADLRRELRRGLLIRGRHAQT